jgi:hypothetical protein
MHITCLLKSPTTCVCTALLTTVVENVGNESAAINKPNNIKIGCNFLIEYILSPCWGIAETIPDTITN